MALEVMLARVRSIVIEICSHYLPLMIHRRQCVKFLKLSHGPGETLTDTLSRVAFEQRNPMPNRFVILHHSVAGSEHWDLMLEHDDVLLTWQLAAEPVNVSSLPIMARRIEDHRKAYLDYQGAISGGRGHVSRVDAGTMHLKEFTARRFLIRLDGLRLVGEFILSQESGADWIFDRVIKQMPELF